MGPGPHSPAQFGGEEQRENPRCVTLAAGMLAGIPSEAAELACRNNDLVVLETAKTSAAIGRGRRHC